MPITPRRHVEDVKLKSNTPLKEIKDIVNVEMIGSNEKLSRKPSLKQVDQMDPNVERKTFKRMTTNEYDRKVLSIRELNLKDRRQFVFNPPPEGKIVQVSIFRDKHGFKNRFYPKYHVMFSVR